MNWNRSLSIVALIVPALCIAGSALGYELQTHSNVTYSAFKSFMLRHGELGDRLGISLALDHSYGGVYFDGPENHRRDFDPFEAARISKTEPLAEVRSLAGWMMAGAIREDDLSESGCFINNFFELVHNRDRSACNPPDDRYGAIDRVVNHFYDPKYDRPLTIVGFEKGAKAPNWGSGLVNAFTDPTQATSNRRNHFAWVDARKAMYRALSGRVPGNTSNGDTFADEAQRKAWWATTFRALGSAMHTLQDMAQPQHTRNDPHPASAFEDHVDARAKGAATYPIDGGATVPLAPLPLGEQAPILFNRLSHMWSTVPRGDDLQWASGLADFSNRAFLTEGTNIGQLSFSPYSLPSRNAGDYLRENVTDPALGGTDRVVKFLLWPSDDTFLYSGQRYARMTTESAFSDYSGKGPEYTMNHYNFSDHADVLIPKAISYSASLLEYFFRGSLDCATGVTVNNECFVQNFGAETAEGTLEFFYDSVDGLRRPVPNSRVPVVLPPRFRDRTLGTRVLLDIPADQPQPKTRGEYILVFTGKLGQEDAVEEYGGAVVGRVVTPRRFLATGASQHGLVAQSDGTILGWGDNQFGELGNGGYRFTIPYGSPGPTYVYMPDYKFFSDTKEVAKGERFSLARKADGTVWAWGYGFDGQMGTGGFPFITLNPVQVAELTDVMSISAGGATGYASGHGLALRRDGRIWSWGANAYGQRGDGTVTSSRDPSSVPKPVVTLSDVTAVAAGGFHSLALTADRKVFAWGNNWYGQLGTGSTQPRSVTGGMPTPSLVAALPNVKAIAAGGGHNLALLEDGTVWAWGQNDFGQIGDGSRSTSQPYAKASPTPVLGLSDIVAISAGSLHSVALKKDGTVWVWGSNGAGQAGIGTYTSAETVPKQVIGLQRVIEVSAGAYHNTALTLDGVLWSWGSNSLGELANGTFTPTATATRSFDMADF